MSFVNLWQEARGNVLRKRYEGLKSRIDAADAAAKTACFGVVKSNFELLKQSLCECLQRGTKASFETRLKDCASIGRCE